MIDYLILDTSSCGNKAELEKSLADYAKDGWELVAVVAHEHVARHYFRRERGGCVGYFSGTRIPEFPNSDLMDNY